jgi:hypothetical protein
LPAAINPSASRSFLMISSGVCLFFFMRVSTALRAAVSHNFWISFRGALQRGAALERSSQGGHFDSRMDEG